MAILSIVRGLSIAASFITAGQLVSASIVTVPNILKLADEETISAQVLAKQFIHSLNIGKLSQAPAELLSIIAFGFLAYHTRIVNPESSSWKFYTGAAISMFTVLPWTLAVMDKDSKRISSISQARVSHVDDKEAKLEHGSLAAPAATDGNAVTPVEEFEPYEDAPFSGAEYEKLKVRQLLKNWHSLNMVRVASTAIAGALALAAVTTRVTLVTIVQGT